MQTLLITGFAPFGGALVNASWEAVARLPERVGDYRLVRVCLPVVFGEAAEAVLAEAERCRPDVILAVGVAGGREAVTPEYVGINLRHARIPDNAGAQPLDTPVVEGGPAAYFATVPVRAMADAITAAGIAARVSYSAGTFVCNDLLYALAHRYADTPIRVGFIHVPLLPEQAGEGRAAMPCETVVAALIAAIEALGA